MPRIVHWSEEEIEIMTKHYPTATHLELRQLLPTRSHTAIKHQAKKMRVRKTFKEHSTEKLDKHSRQIHSGVISKRGNVTIHRMR